MALFPILTSDGDSILTSDGWAVVVAGASTVTSIDGTILVPSDQLLNRGTLISALDGAVVTGTLPILDSELGAQLPNQIFGLLNGGPFTIYNPDFSERATAAIFSSPWSTLSASAAWGVNTFYVAKWLPGGHPTQVGTCDQDGNIGAMIWTLPTNNAPQGIAVTADGHTLYWGDVVSTQGFIRAFDLQTSAALPDFFVGALNSLVAEGEILIYPDGTIFFAYCPNGNETSPNQNWEIRRYSPAGALLQTYPLGHGEADGNDVHLARDQHDPTVLWVRSFLDPTGNTSNFKRLKIADGSVLTDFTVPTGNAAPNVPGSCPFFVFTPNATTYAVRRQRIFALPYNQNLYQFISRLEIVLQSGMGLSSGQGAQPVIMLRLSKDGGQTWGPEVPMNAGAQGEYDKRVYVNRLGRARNWVAEVTTSDPILWALLLATVDVESGTS